MHFMQRRFYSPNSDAGTPPSAQQPPAQAPDPQAGFESLLSRNANDAQRVAWLLYQENHGYREETRQLREQMQQAQAQAQQLQGQLPADGSTVLNGDLASAWTRYQELGTPDEIAELRRSHAALQRGQLLGEAARAHGYKASVLSTLAGETLALELRPNADNSGQTAYVVTGENQATPLPEYAQAHWADFLPALADKPAGVTFPRQTAGGKQPDVDPIQAELKRRYQSK